jgi:hypothetical protein
MNPEGLNYGDLLVSVVSKLASWQTSEPQHRSVELASEWSLGHHSRVRASQDKCLSIQLDKG